MSSTRLVAVVATLLMAGCGSSSASHPKNYAYQPSAVRIPTCAHPSKPIHLPSGFPAAFPFPTGTLIQSTKPLLKNQIGIYGFVPSTGFAATVNFFKNQVPKAGFTRLNFEVDAPNDSEGTYKGHGKIGRWQLRSIRGCAAMTFAASAEPST